MKEVKSIQEQFANKESKETKKNKKKRTWHDAQCEWMRKNGKVWIQWDRPFGGGEFEY